MTSTQLPSSLLTSHRRLSVKYRKIERLSSYVFSNRRKRINRSRQDRRLLSLKHKQSRLQSMLLTRKLLQRLLQRLTRRKRPRKRLARVNWLKLSRNKR
jgi:hypothetical protein